MRRYKIVKDSEYGPPQYLGGVGKYDVFYWTAAHDGKERLIVKWDSGEYSFYYWDFRTKYWKTTYMERAGDKGPSKEETETILAMYECFAIKPQAATTETSAPAR